MSTPRCRECSRPCVKLNSGAGFVCPASHGQIVQAEPPPQLQLSLQPDGVLPFDGAS